MRLAILADIHANRYALEAVLADLDTQGADRVIVNGDLVNRGPDNVVVLELLWPRGYPATLGNHDDLMVLWTRRDSSLPQTWFGDPFWAAAAWSAAQLEASGWLPRLAELPMTYALALPEAPSVLVAHGTPRHYREGLGARLSDESLSELLQHHPTDVLVGSHTHSAFQKQWGRRLILNTGSVGAPFDGDPRAQYLLLTLRNGCWQPEFRRVPYDRRPALAAFETSGLLEVGGLSARIFYTELQNARSYLTPFWMWTETEGLPQDWSTWQRFQQVFAARFAPAESP